jgi:chitinase
MSSVKTILAGAAILAGLHGAQAALDLSSTSNIAVYWGELRYAWT